MGDSAKAEFDSALRKVLSVPRKQIEAEERKYQFERKRRRKPKGT